MRRTYRRTVTAMIAVGLPFGAVTATASAATVAVGTASVGCQHGRGGYRRPQSSLRSSIAREFWGTLRASA